jgi:hypothetical protein
MKAQHTAGPWNCDETEKTFHTKGLNLRAPDGSSIAALFGSKSDECIANASLIAAAPDLLATCKARTKLSRRLKQVEIISAHKILGQIYDGPLKAGLTVVVGRLFCHVARKLSHLHVAHQVLLETRVDNLALRRLEAICHVWN